MMEEAPASAVPRRRVEIPCPFRPGRCSRAHAACARACRGAGPARVDRDGVPGSSRAAVGLRDGAAPGRVTSPCPRAVVLTANGRAAGEYRDGGVPRAREEERCGRRGAPRHLRGIAHLQGRRGEYRRVRVVRELEVAVAVRGGRRVRDLRDALRRGDARAESAVEAAHVRLHGRHEDRSGARRGEGADRGDRGGDQEWGRVGVGVRSRVGVRTCVRVRVCVCVCTCVRTCVCVCVCVGIRSCTCIRRLTASHSSSSSVRLRRVRDRGAVGSRLVPRGPPRRRGARSSPRFSPASRGPPRIHLLEERGLTSARISQ